jgi:tetratricopeptide (TPR) repeat protein
VARIPQELQSNRRMVRYLAGVLVASAAFAAGSVYELSGHIVPRARASVALFGASAPYSASTFVLPGSDFHFRKLQPGAYMLTIFIRSRGEARQTVEVGPSTADRHGRIFLTVRLQDSDFVLAAALDQQTVSAKQLAIPPAARRDYQEALKDLSKHNVDSAVRRLVDAVERAPQFSAAWNNLGTIAYQTGKYDRAEECFREALKQEPRSFEALVNLGGVLVTEQKLDEALDYNGQAVLARPNDALAQSQLGLTYYLIGSLELATKHLEQAIEIDPAHFSHPQLVLFQIHLRQGNPYAAADALEDFLTRHPDWPRASNMRSTIVELRSR